MIAKRATLFGALMLAALWLATVAVSDAPIALITAFWVIVGAIVLGWSRYSDVARDAWVVGLESALRANSANVYDVQATSFVSLQETDDEGGGFVFQLDGGQLLFLDAAAGRCSGRFPSLDFSVVQALDVAGTPVAQWIERRGAKAHPVRKVEAAVAVAPADLSQRPGRLEDLESLLTC